MTLQGWECPKCGQVYGPFVLRCFTCRPNSVNATNTLPFLLSRPCPGCQGIPCRGTSSGCPLPPQPVITCGSVLS